MLVFAAPTSVAPTRLATRVEVAMESENGTWNDVDVIVLKTLCAARCAVPNQLAPSVKISNARYSASSIINPLKDNLTIGP